MSESYRNSLDRVMYDALAQVRQVAGEHIEGLRSQLVDTEQKLDELNLKHEETKKALTAVRKAASLARDDKEAAERKLEEELRADRQDQGRAPLYLKEVEGALDKAYRDVGITRSSENSPSAYVRQIAYLVRRIREIRAARAADLVVIGDLTKERDELRTKLLRVQDLASDITEETQR